MKQSNIFVLDKCEINLDNNIILYLYIYLSLISHVWPSADCCDFSLQWSVHSMLEGCKEFWGIWIVGFWVFLCTFVCVCVYSAAVRGVKLSPNPSENWNHLHFHLTAESNGLDYRPADEMTDGNMKHSQCSPTTCIELIWQYIHNRIVI